MVFTFVLLKKTPPKKEGEASKQKESEQFWITCFARYGIKCPE
jgi:hypothetical protein